ncbi:CarD family transcriptional regulator [Paenibacillus sp. DYY-L-2]|uniref:CarD family transcriptional regulator n=1 Tax=Paenibacillus sp. DYY-L-2 TaxID=3447013 RepID=UPI003F4FFDA4
MFEIGDFIVYGQSGVCQITSIDYPQVVVQGGEKKLYYKLVPVFSSEVIYTPVDTKVYMRPVVTREQAKQLVVEITGETKTPSNPKPNTPDECQALLKTHDCEDLIRVMKIIHFKRYECTQNGKKLTMTDQRMLKQAEELLCSELSVASGNDLDTTKSIIEKALSAWMIKVCG